MALSDKQVDLVQREFSHAQQQIDKYDEFSDKIKTWTMTLWAALMGWSLQSGRKETMLLALVIVFSFWIFDAIKRGVRQDYKQRRGVVVHALRTYMQTASFPKGFVSPEIPEHTYRRNALRHLFMPHMLLLYGPLAIVSIGAFFLL